MTITTDNVRDLRVLVLVNIMIVLDINIMIMVNILALIILALVNILLVALNIEVSGIITMELILHNLHCHITLMLDPLANAGFFSQSSQPTRSHQQTYYYPYENYISDFYTYRRDDDNDDYVPHRNSMLK